MNIDNPVGQLTVSSFELIGWRASQEVFRSFFVFGKEIYDAIWFINFRTCNDY